MPDNTKKPETAKTEQSQVEDLSREPVTERDAQSVKGGSAGPIDPLQPLVVKLVDNPTLKRG